VEALQYLFTISFLYTIRNRKVLPTSLISQPINVKATKTNKFTYVAPLNSSACFVHTLIRWICHISSHLSVCLFSSQSKTDRRCFLCNSASALSLSLDLCIYIFSCRPFHMITKEFVNCHGKALLLSLSFSLAWFPLAAWILCLCCRNR